MMRLILISLAILLFFCCSCAPKMPGGDIGDLRKKLYYDANLAFSVAVPEDWERKFIAPPANSPARYAIFWQGRINPQQPRRVAMDVALLRGDMNDEMIDASLADFSLAHPGFTVTSRKGLTDEPDAPLEILGHSPTRFYKIVHIPAEDRVFRMDFSTPPEDFDGYQPLFDLIIASFQAVD
jgi:hypothetical protein